MAEPARGKGLPLVLTFNCLPDCELERDLLKDVARVQAITAFSKAHVPLLKQVSFLPCGLHAGLPHPANLTSPFAAANGFGAMVSKPWGRFLVLQRASLEMIGEPKA